MFCRQRRDADPKRLLARDLRRRKTLCPERLVEYRSKKVETEESDTPQTNHAGKSEHHADEGVFSPPRVS